MAFSIHLDDELSGGAVKIRRASLERVLPSKLQSVGTLTEDLPETRFRRRHGSPQPPRPQDGCVSSAGV
jgi:hypothetical protein